MLRVTWTNTLEHAAGPPECPPLGVKGSQVQILSSRHDKRPAQLAFYVGLDEYVDRVSTRHFARTSVRFGRSRRSGGLSIYRSRPRRARHSANPCARLIGVNGP